MERKKKAALQHKKEIDAQIAEKRRIQQLEEEIQQLNSIKIENEARQIATTNHSMIKHARTFIPVWQKCV